MKSSMDNYEYKQVSKKIETQNRINNLLGDSDFDKRIAAQKTEDIINSKIDSECSYLNEQNRKMDEAMDSTTPTVDSSSSIGQLLSGHLYNILSDFRKKRGDALDELVKTYKVGEIQYQRLYYAITLLKLTEINQNRSKEFQRLEDIDRLYGNQNLGNPLKGPGSAIFLESSVAPFFTKHLEYSDQDVFEVCGKFPKNIVGKYVYGSLSLYEFYPPDSNGYAYIRLSSKNFRIYDYVTKDYGIISAVATWGSGEKFNIPMINPLQIIQRNGSTYVIKDPREEINLYELDKMKL